MAGKRIGSFTLNETTDYRKGYETASWYKTIRCEPQTVDIIGCTIGGGEPKDGERPYWALITLRGTVTDAFFPSSFGGVMYGDGRRPNEIGKEDRYTIQAYGYDVIDHADRWANATIKLGDE